MMAFVSSGTSSFSNQSFISCLASLYFRKLDDRESCHFSVMNLNISCCVRYNFLIKSMIRLFCLLLQLLREQQGEVKMEEIHHLPERESFSFL